ncbi:hypothetical protein [Ekhidna sp.]|uniref:hypothetical protein n=2 Tax=Ekhidna sp. TaxID=2608089 RepID=UPI003BAD8F2E
MEAIKKNYKTNPIYTVSMLVFGVGFFVRGVDYLILGSVAPFIIGTFMLSGIYYAFLKKNKSSRRLMKIIAVMLIFWGVVRLGLELLFSFVPVTEAHIMSQFTWTNKCLSISAILFGIYFFKNQKFNQTPE